VDFEGAVAVVTGGASGIGRALGEKLLSLGARVALLDLEPTAANKVATGLDPGGSSVVGLAADVTQAESLAGAVAEVERRFGPVDMFFSNAGVAVGEGLGDPQSWQLSFEVHVMGHVNAALAVLEGMASRQRGVFVVTASAAGLLMMMQSAPYSVTKHGSVAIAEWLAVHYGGSGVSVHCLCPQGVRTPMIGTDPKGKAEVEASGRILEPSQVADAVIEAIRSGTFLILPHPEVKGYEQAKVADRDRWLAGMRRLLARVRA